MSSPAPYPPSSAPLYSDGLAPPSSDPAYGGARAGPSSQLNSSAPNSRPIIDPLAFEGVRGLHGSIPGANGTGRADEAEEEGATGTGARRGVGRQARLNDTDDVPRVKDATGEKVMESFAMFLEK